MARGMVNGERIVSQASTDEFRENHERIFGERKPCRGRWVWDPEEQRLVSAEDYRPQPRAVDGTIMVDRFMEGAVAPDGTDIGSRRKRQAYMRETGVVDASDCSSRWYEGQKRERERQTERSTESAFDRAARKLYAERKLKD
jgi:hypothetical protein